MSRSFCDCPLYMTFTHFCAQQNCNGYRRLCANCKSDHKHGQGSIIQFEHEESFNSFSLNLNNKNKQSISTEIRKTLEAANLSLANISKIKNQKNKNLIKDKFEKNVLRPLNVLLGTTDNKQQIQKRKQVTNKAAQVEQLNEIAYQVKKLQQEHFKDANWINKFCEKLRANLQRANKDLKAQEQAVENHLKFFEGLKPIRSSKEHLMVQILKYIF